MNKIVVGGIEAAIREHYSGGIEAAIREHGGVEVFALRGAGEIPHSVVAEVDHEEKTVTFDSEPKPRRRIKKPNRYHMLAMLWTFALSVALSYRPPEMAKVDLTPTPTPTWDELLTDNKGNEWQLNGVLPISNGGIAVDSRVVFEGNVSSWTSFSGSTGGGTSDITLPTSATSARTACVKLTDGGLVAVECSKSPKGDK